MKDDIRRRINLVITPNLILIVAFAIAFLLCPAARTKSLGQSSIINHQSSSSASQPPNSASALKPLLPQFYPNLRRMMQDQSHASAVQGEAMI